MIRRIPFQGALNFRDIGGYPAAGGLQTRWRLIYRSDSRHFLTAEDLPVFDALGVRSIYDLRRQATCETTLDRETTSTSNLPAATRQPQRRARAVVMPGR
jgi:protein-tyrosine phosphatase